MKRWSPPSFCLRLDYDTEDRQQAERCSSPYFCLRLATTRQTGSRR